MLAKASGWRSIPGTMRNVVFLEHQQAGRVEGVETEPLGRSQSREGCVGCRRALMQLGLLQAKLTGLEEGLLEAILSKAGGGGAGTRAILRKQNQCPIGGGSEGQESG